MKSGESSIKLFIPDDMAVLKVFREIRWSNGVYCPVCESKNTIKRGFRA